MPGWRSYHVTVEFAVPLSFAFRWCTDYTADDGKYAGEDSSINLRRKVVSKSRRCVVFENVYDVGRGWGWERHTVTLTPPDRWHSHGVGNYHESVLDYSLTAIADDRTRFDMRWKSRPVGLARGPRPPASRVEAYVTQLWKSRARHLEGEFRRPETSTTGSSGGKGVGKNRGDPSARRAAAESPESSVRRLR